MCSSLEVLRPLGFVTQWLWFLFQLRKLRAAVADWWSVIFGLSITGQVRCDFDFFVNGKKKGRLFTGLQLRGEDLNLRPLGYEPNELPLLHPASIETFNYTGRVFNRQWGGMPMNTSGVRL